MLPDYVRHWGLERAPFALTPDPEMLYMSNQHRECLLRLKYAVISGKGGALLVSENAGDGKTSVLRRLGRDLESELDGRLQSAFISHPTLEPREMIEEISRQLGGATPGGSKMDALGALGDRLHELYSQGEKVVVIVDEGQMLAHRPDMLQELRILLNFCVADAFLLTFIFSGQAPLEPAVRSMPEFWQRLPVRYFLRNLERNDVWELLRHRTEVAGAEDRIIFNEDAANLIHRYSSGCPRVICSIADLALVIGHSQRAKEIGAQEVQLAGSDMGLTEGGREAAFHYFHFVAGESPAGGGAGSARKSDGASRGRRKRRAAQPGGEEAAPNQNVSGVEPTPSQELRGEAEVEALSVGSEMARPATIHACPNCHQVASSRASTCTLCGRRLEIVCQTCHGVERAGEANCGACGEPITPEEERLRVGLEAGVTASGLTVASVSSARRARRVFRRATGEEMLLVIRPGVDVNLSRANSGRARSSGGASELLITNLAVGLAMRSSFARLPLERLEVGTSPLADLPSAVGLELNIDGLSYRVSAGQRDLAPLASALSIWVAGKQALLGEVGARGSRSS